MPLDDPRPYYATPEWLVRGVAQRLQTFSAPQLAAELGLCDRAARYRLAKLIADGLVVRIKHGTYKYIGKELP